MGMPKMLGVLFEEMLYAADSSFSLYSALTAGSCLAIDAHASEAQGHLPAALYEGRWAGTMCLTEPHAGTDLGLIRTRAEPQADGSSHQRQQDLHHRWRAGPDREHRPPGAGALPDAPAGAKASRCSWCRNTWSSRWQPGRAQRRPLRFDRTQDGHQGLGHLRDELRPGRGVIWLARRTRAWRRCSP
jgi:hypothetical protein